MTDSSQASRPPQGVPTQSHRGAPRLVSAGSKKRQSGQPADGRGVSTQSAGGSASATRTSEKRSTDGETRRRIMLALLQMGPLTAAELARDMDMTPAGIRRHIDALEREGLAEVSPHPNIKNNGHVSRGRPAKAYRLTDNGRDRFGTRYDTLASHALAALRESGGTQALKDFAEARVNAIVEGVEPADGSPESIEETVDQLVEAFAEYGCAPSVSRAGEGIQILQHHCPIAAVAEHFPEMCRAEYEAVSRLVGMHIQPLATIADGHGVCTTNIPLTKLSKKGSQRTPSESSRSVSPISSLSTPEERSS